MSAVSIVLYFILGTILGSNLTVDMYDLARHPVSSPHWAGRMSAMTQNDRESQCRPRILKHAEETGYVGRTCRNFGIGRASF